jgi:hypothetical protein
MAQTNVGTLCPDVEMLEAREQGRDFGAAQRVGSRTYSAEVASASTTVGCAKDGVATLAAAAPAAKARTRPRRLKPSSICSD